MPSIFPLVGPEKALEAFQAFVLPGIHNAMSQGHVTPRHLCIVALRPGVPYKSGAKMPVMFEYHIGVKSEWKWPYHEYAHGKARVSWRTGLSSREVCLMKPHLLMPGDPLYWGSVNFNGIIVGCSGLSEHFDEMFALMTAIAISTEATHYALLAQGDGAPDFVPEPPYTEGSIFVCEPSPDFTG